MGKNYREISAVISRALILQENAANRDCSGCFFSLLYLSVEVISLTVSFYVIFFILHLLFFGDESIHCSPGETKEVGVYLRGVKEVIMSGD